MENRPYWFSRRCFMYYVPQIQKDDCGYACVKMLLANVQKDKNFLFLPQDENHGPYSYQDLIDIAKGHGIILNGYTVEDKSTIKEHKKFPMLCHCLAAACRNECRK